MKKNQSPNQPGRKVDGLRKFAAEYGFTMEQIKEVRKTADGSASVRQNEVDPPAFCRAFNAMVKTAEKVPLGFATWKDYDAAGKAKTTWVELKKIEGKLGEHSEFQRQAGAAVGYVFQELERMTREQPPALSGRSSVEIAERLEAAVKQIKLKLQSDFGEISK